MIVYLSGKVEVFGYLGLLAVSLYLYDGSLDVPKVTLIDFQGFLLQSFSGISPVALRRFFYSEYVPSVMTSWLP